MGYLIDTSIFVAWERGQIDASMLRDAAREQPVALCAVTASELLHGVHRAESAQRRGRRETFVEAILEAVPVIPFDLDAARFHARIWSDLRARGVTIGAHDLLIAATALARDLTVATRNARDFARIEDLCVASW